MFSYFLSTLYCYNLSDVICTFFLCLWLVFLFSSIFLRIDVLNFDDIQFNNTFLFWMVILVSYKKSLPNQRLQSFPPVFSSSSFIVWGFMLRCIINFELSYMVLWIKVHNFTIRHPVVSVSFIEKTIISRLNYSRTFVKKSMDHLYVGLFLDSSVPLVCLYACTILSELL